MNFTETAMVAVVTLGIGASAVVVLNPSRTTQRVQMTADQASCRAVELAVVAYLEERQRPPTSIAELQPYVRGRIAAYRLVGGVPVGPGCAVPPAR